MICQDRISEAIYALLTDKDILRDYFAGCALKGVSIHAVDYTAQAKRAYEIADAMLAAREEKTHA